MHVGVFQALPGRLGGLQEPPGASRGLQGLPRGLEGFTGAEISRGGQAGLGHPPLAGAGGGRLRLRGVCKGGEGVFKGI